MHVHNNPGGLPAVDAKQLQDRLTQAIQQRRQTLQARDLQTTPAPQPLPTTTKSPSAAPLGIVPSATEPSLATLPADQVAEIAESALQQGAPEDALSATNQPTPEQTLQSLLDAWDTNNKENDLNGDSVVNVFDLFQLLSSLKPAQPSAEDNPLSAVLITTTGTKPIPKPDTDPNVKPVDAAALPGTDTNALTGPVETESEEPALLTLEALTAAFGSSDARYDLNNDGTVNVFDLFQYLSSQQSPSSNDKAAVLASADQTSGLVFSRTPAAHRLDEQKLQHMADRLVHRLQDAGFDQHPPANLNDILGQLNLNDDQRQVMLQRVAQHYPAGLGVSVIG